jgi:hypothetical protein
LNPALPTAVPATETREATAAATAEPTAAILQPTATQPRPTLAADEWRSLPVIPQVSETTRAIYRRGIELGNNAQAFSKIGDCGSIASWFLGDFDRGPSFYRLGDHSELQTVIDHFQGSFERTSLAAKEGFSASSVLAPLWSNRKECEADETPLACEYRLHRPVIALIMLGTNDVFHPDRFEPQMRKIIEYSMENGVIPVLSTKADNEEGDGSLNATIARLATEYDIPLWNFWLAVQALPDQGLQPDQVHVTWGPNRFDDPQVMERGWPVRNLTALQVLDSIWQGVNEQEE